MQTPQETIKKITDRDEADLPAFFSKKELFMFMEAHAGYAVQFESELYQRANAENLRCLRALQDFVQEHVVPLDPVMVIGKLATIDKAIEYYFAQLELKRKAGKDIIETCRQAFIELGSTDMPKILQDALERL